MKRDAQLFSYSHAAQILDVTRPQLLRCLRNHDALLTDETAPKPWAVEAGYLRTYHGDLKIGGVVPKAYRTGRVTIQGLAWLDQLLNTQAKAA